MYSKNTGSESNACLLVLIDSGGNHWKRIIVRETIFAALEHYGIPYRVLDMAEHKLTGEDLSGCAGVLIAQQDIGKRFSGKDVSLLKEAVSNGLGLINFDNSLRNYPRAYYEIFGFEKLNPAPYATNILSIKSNGHYITGMRRENPDFYNLKKMISATLVEKHGENVHICAEAVLGKEQLIYTRHLVPGGTYEPGSYPIVLAADYGKGKAVQFLVSPKLWLNGIMGHARGIDDLFWRSIIWTVRKPFAANIIPPFITMSFDDSRGLYDFEYLETANQYGYKPLCSLLIRDVPERLFSKIRKLYAEGKSIFNTHALDYYNLLAFDFGRGEYSHKKLQEIFSYEDEWWKRAGFRQSMVIVFTGENMGQTHCLS
ncbi:MAG: hypothetical protein PHV82_06085 [Victivallaceae bacterium]|nr:hypothetical protein [Victivallaceae bacterium]